MQGQTRVGNSPACGNHSGPHVDEFARHKQTIQTYFGTPQSWDNVQTDVSRDGNDRLIGHGHSKRIKISSPPPIRLEFPGMTSL